MRYESLDEAVDVIVEFFHIKFFDEVAVSGIALGLCSVKPACVNLNQSSSTSASTAILRIKFSPILLSLAISKEDSNKSSRPRR